MESKLKNVFAKLRIYVFENKISQPYKTATTQPRNHRNYTIT